MGKAVCDSFLHEIYKNFLSQHHVTHLEYTNANEMHQYFWAPVLEFLAGSLFLKSYEMNTHRINDEKARSNIDGDGDWGGGDDGTPDNDDAWNDNDDAWNDNDTDMCRSDDGTPDNDVVGDDYRVEYDEIPIDFLKHFMEHYVPILAFMKPIFNNIENIMMDYICMKHDKQQLQVYDDLGQSRNNDKMLYFWALKDVSLSLSVNHTHLQHNLVWLGDMFEVFYTMEKYYNKPEDYSDIMKFKTWLLRLTDKKTFRVRVSKQNAKGIVRNVYRALI